MEPRALMTTNTTPFKDMKDNKLCDLDKTDRALSELSLTNGMGTFGKPLI